MTAQAPDLVEFDGRTFSLVGARGGPLFDPASLGVKPAMMNTACWRGFVATYRVAGERLTLEGLLLGVDSKLNGKKLDGATTLLGRSPTRDEGGYAYGDLGLEVPFSGGLLLGDGFISGLYVHMGFQPAWKYQTVMELLVKDGQVEEAHDRSEEVALVRTQIEAGQREDPDGRKGGLAWVERTFTLDYSRTFGDK